MNELLLLVQVDDATGETLQHATQQILAAGARNVQILASTTKKGRTGHVCLIDVPAQHEDEVALLLGTELGVWGYRVLEARHRHFDIATQMREVIAQTAAASVSGSVRCKRICKGGHLLAIKAEHDDLVRLQAALAAHDCRLALRRLRALVETEAMRRADGEAIRIVAAG